MNLTRPERLSKHHDLSEFKCVDDTFTLWLQNSARRYMKSNASITYVVSDIVNNQKQVIAYYTLSACTEKRENLPRNTRRNMPVNIPFTLLGMLAVDHRKEKLRIGRGLVKDAMIRTYEQSNIIASAGLFVDAISERAKKWYEGMDFIALPDNTLRLFLGIKDITKNVIIPRIIDLCKALRDQEDIECSEIEHIIAALVLKQPDLLPAGISKEKAEAIIDDRGINLVETIRSQYKKEL